MKILAIRGKNLASLANEFCVDFEAEPLASAGLYAITGATGSGKSTLLDALCLALYERTPRLARATAQGETIPDVGAHSVGPADPRTLLRRGASDGFAEVDFVGSDAVAYRARWSVRRARSKADGRLQQSEMSLLRLADKQLLGDHRKSETLKLIERCIGLSFEQFTRAVLLAQNDFAAFLKASDDDRAELLQTLTGTETFTRLSKLAFVRARAQGDELKLLGLQLDAQLPLAPEARSAKAGESAALLARVKAIEQQQGAIEGKLRWQQQWEKFKANSAEARASFDAARSARDGSALRQAQFVRVEAVQPARPLFAEVDRLDREIAGGAQALKDGQLLLAQAFKDAGDGQDALKAVACELQRAEQAKAEAQPGVDQARAIDAQISALTPNFHAAVKAADEAKLSLAQEDAKRQALSDELFQSQAALQLAERWLVEHAPVRPLAAGWQRWETLLAHASAVLGEHRTSAAQGLQFNKKEDAIKAALDKAGADHLARVSEHGAAAKKLDDLTRALAAFRPDELAEHRQTLERRRNELAGAASLWHQLGQQQQRQQQLQGQQQSHLATLNDCQLRLARCAAARPPAEHDRASAEKSLRIAELAASASVEELRATLEAGDPCPVCGSLQHPYAEHDPRLSGVLNALRDELLCARKRETDLVQAESAAAAQNQALQKQMAQLEHDLATARAAVHQAERLWLAQPLTDELLPVANEDRAAWLAEKQTAVHASLAGLGQQESGYRQAIRLKDCAQEATSQAQAAMSAARNSLARFELEHQQTAQASQSARQRLAASEQQLAAAQLELDAAFADTSWREDWIADPPGFVARCQFAVQDWTARQRQVDALSARLNTLATSIQGALAAVANATRYCQGQADQCALLERDLREKQARRKALFDGKAIGAIEAALSAAIGKAKLDLNQRQSTSQKADAEAARINEAVRLAAVQRERNQTLLASARQALMDWLHAFNAQHSGLAALSADLLKDLLAFGPQWIDGERQALQAVDGALANAFAVLEAQQKAQAEHLAGLPDEDLAESAELAPAGERLRVALEQALAELEPARAQLSAVQFELAQDDERRQKSLSLLADLEKQSVKARVWSQLSDLIGSADGKKFRNFAQQLTLDILLGYANRHLETLSRRYRLQRVEDSLGLLVVDRDMGDEVRSVHSLSGGESFLVSLALALGLASLSSHRVRVESLFIDEGFGSLDGDALSVAMEALENLQAQGRKVGVISHVQEMTELIGTRIKVKRLPGGQSRVLVAA
jgi:exonuclease SbcC